MENVTRVWKDPVRSKVISTGIIWAIVWLDQHFTSVQLPRWLIWASAAVALALVVFAGITHLLRKRASDSINTSPANHGDQPCRIEIYTEGGRPFQESTIESGHVLSTVRVGIKNFGGKTLSNYRVYVEKVSPPDELIPQVSVLLGANVFTLRPDDPEQLVEVAAHWDHMVQFRFSTPAATGFYEALQYLDGQTKRTFVNRVSARECERSALFEIWADDSKKLHLRFHKLHQLINRRLTKRQQMRWSMKGAHYLLQTRVWLIHGRS
ncbi:hypothetical protein [Paraburkholderia dipogonis]|uniref:hypothetical protein n=1 Tax=Paraburkholderia dipogonis TaxID=1211383 RepID=UPI0038BD0E17